MDERQTALIAEREKEGVETFLGADRRPSQEVVQLSAASYLKCRKKTAQGMERREDDGKDHWNISAFSNAASGLGFGDGASR